MDVAIGIMDHGLDDLVDGLSGLWEALLGWSVLAGGEMISDLGVSERLARHLNDSTIGSLRSRAGDLDARSGRRSEDGGGHHGDDDLDELHVQDVLSDGEGSEGVLLQVM